jgi:hypothetical protein
MREAIAGTQKLRKYSVFIAFIVLSIAPKAQAGPGGISLSRCAIDRAPVLTLRESDVEPSSN